MNNLEVRNDFEFKVQPFRSWKLNPENIGSLSDVVLILEGLNLKY